MRRAGHFRVWPRPTTHHQTESNRQESRRLLGQGKFSDTITAAPVHGRCRPDLAPHTQYFDHLVGAQIASHRGIGQVSLAVHEAGNWIGESLWAAQHRQGVVFGACSGIGDGSERADQNQGGQHFFSIVSRAYVSLRVACLRTAAFVAKRCNAARERHAKQEARQLDDTSRSSAFGKRLSDGKQQVFALR